MNWKIIGAAALLAGCDRDQPPAPSTEQAGQLNEAEDLLDQMGKEEGAAPTGTAPPNNEANSIANQGLD